MESVALYCICGQPYEETRFMIQCDNCREWFHGSCVDVYEYDSFDLDKYHCPQCEMTSGPSIFKQPTNLHRHNFFELDAESKPVQTGTAMFIEELKTRHFPSSEPVVTRMTAQELTTDHLHQTGFDQPIIVEEKEGLGLKVPSEYFTVQDIASLVGSDRMVDVIDVNRQSGIRMCVGDFAHYFNQPLRRRIFNLISLEFSDTRMSEVVEPPLVSRQLDWVNNIWPMSIGTFPTVYKRPEVQKYCLVSVKDSYTDFHIDFGGTSVWYHILRGEKIFYLIKPTLANLSLYERWMASSTQNETFFGDQVDCCYRCILHAGHTMFIPTGWIHAVLTPVDSLVFGGNFLHSLNISLQLQIYEIEKKIHTGDKFMFPAFETINWYAAQRLCEELKIINDESNKVPPYLLTGVKALLTTLKQWSQDRDTQKSRREEIPVIVDAPKLLKELSKEIRHAERFLISLNPPKPERESKRKKKKPVNKDFFDYSQPNLAALLEPKQEPKVPMMKLNMKMINKKTVKEETVVRPPLKLTLPKPVTYPYSTPLKAENISLHQELNECIGGSALPGGSNGSIPRLRDGQPSIAPGLQLHGSSWIITNEIKSPNVKMKAVGTGLKVRLAKAEMHPSTATSSSSRFSPVASTSTYQEHAQEQKPSTDSVYDFHDDSSVADEDDDCLTIDESPRRRRWSKGSVETQDIQLSQTSSPSSALSGIPFSMSSMLSLSGTSFMSSAFSTDTSVPPIPTPNKAKSRTKQKDRILMTLKNVKRVKLNESVDPNDGSSPPKNGIEELLKASGYTQADTQRIEDLESGRTSPSTREAIAGMLSISRVGYLGNGQTGSPQPSTSRGKKRKNSPPSEEVEDIEKVHQDDDFIYPALDVSDDEESERPSRSNKKTTDETWSPKARVGNVAPKTDRPSRDGAKKQSVEKGLEAAAAKRAGLPNPKKHYLQMKPRLTSFAATKTSAKNPKRPYHRKKPRLLSSGPANATVTATVTSATVAAVTEPLLVEPSTSASTSSSSTGHMQLIQGSLLSQSSHTPSASTSSLANRSHSINSDKGRKPKKGMATAKQRLGKILKIHKMYH